MARHEEQLVEVVLPDLRLEAGASVTAPLARMQIMAPPGAVLVDAAARVSGEAARALASGQWVERSGAALDRRRDELSSASVRLDSDLPVVLVVHALTGDMRLGGDGGWWAPLVGPGRPLDPTRAVLLCVNNLGSCYGSAGPADADFPHRDADEEPWAGLEGPGGFDPAAACGAGVRLPATITTWDQARFLLAALDAIRVERPITVAGGSVGGMIALALATLAPDRVDRVLPIAASAAAGAWIQGFNHTARMLVLSDPDSASGGGRGLELARQIAHMTYRAPAGLSERQGRRQAERERWSAGSPYAVQTYLEYQGRKLRRRFHAGAYLAQLDAMDHHDISRRPPGTDAGPWGLARLTMPLTAIGIDSDMLYPAIAMRQVVDALLAHGRPAAYRELRSAHGHDGFLIEWTGMATLLAEALDTAEAR